MVSVERWNNVFPVPSDWGAVNKIEVASEIKRKISEMTIHQNGAPIWYNA